MKPVIYFLILISLTFGAIDGKVWNIPPVSQSDLESLSNYLLSVSGPTDQSNGWFITVPGFTYTNDSMVPFLFPYTGSLRDLNGYMDTAPLGAPLRVNVTINGSNTVSATNLHLTFLPGSNRATTPMIFNALSNFNWMDLGMIQIKEVGTNNQGNPLRLIFRFWK